MNDPYKLTRGGIYPLSDYHPQSKLLPSTAPDGSREELRARWDGEKRAPKRDEWFLSGAYVEAYRARHDMTEVFPIATIVVVRRRTVIEEEILCEVEPA